MPASVPVLTDLHALDNMIAEGTSMNSAASPSASRLLSSSKTMSKIPAAPKSTNNTKPNTLNKGAHKPSTMGANQLAALDQQLPRGPPDTVQAYTEDLLNLKVVIQSRGVV